jgi:hypothetical protein
LLLCYVSYVMLLLLLCIIIIIIIAISYVGLVRDFIVAACYVLDYYYALLLCITPPQQGE